MWRSSSFQAIAESLGVVDMELSELFVGGKVGLSTA